MGLDRLTPLDSFVDGSAPICYGILKPGKHQPNGIPVIKVKNIVGGRILEGELLETTEEIHRKYKRSEVKEGDLLLTIRGSAGRLAIVPSSLTGANITQDTARIRVSSDDDPLYVFYALQSPRVARQIELNTVGQAVKGINIAEVRKLKLYHPELRQQLKIAKILSTWDQAIAATEQLLANSEQQKNALMQQLLTGKKRLPGFKLEWSELALGELFYERKEAGIADLPLLSVTSEYGIISRDDVGRKDTSSADKSKYLRVCPGDIAYNTMRMWQGVSALSSLEGIVSPAYTVLTPKSRTDSRFTAYLFKLPEMVHRFYRHSQGLVSDTWNLKYQQFAKIKVVVPCVDEQTAIADVLAKEDELLACVDAQLQQLKSEKKALMQQLLTGKRRVKVAEAEPATA